MKKNHFSPQFVKMESSIFPGIQNKVIIYKSQNSVNRADALWVSRSFQGQPIIIYKLTLIMDIVFKSKVILNFLLFSSEGQQKLKLYTAQMAFYLEFNHTT